MLVSWSFDDFTLGIGVSIGIGIAANVVSV